MIKIIVILLFVRAILTRETIRFAAVIYRHGDRTPVDTYPTDPYRNESLWPVKFGQLTNTGKEQHYEFGKWLHLRYSDLLPANYQAGQVRVQSTDVDRTIMSAEVNNAGLFPPSGNSIWNKNIPWQPVPIHTKPEKDDEVLAMKKLCPAYEYEMANLVKSPAFQQHLRKYQSLMNYLEAKTGKPIKTYEDINNIYSTLYIEKLYSFPLPDWTKGYFPEKMREPAAYSFSISAMTPKLARLRAGPLLKEILSHIDKAVSNHNYSLKLSIYSGHDFTIGTMLTALKLFDFQVPVYTSAIFFELIEDSVKKMHFIKISYRNTTYNATPTVLSIPYCGQMCPVARFKQVYENLYTVKFDEECNNNGFLYRPTLFGSAISIVTVFLVLLFVVSKLRARQPDKDNNPRRNYCTNIHMSPFYFGRTDNV